MAGLLRQGHFLGSKLRSLRKRNGLTLDELSARCVQLEPDHAPSVSYLSMVETGKRVPSPQMLGVLAAVFGKEPSWFLDRTEALPPQQLGAARHQGPVNAMALEPAFLFSKDLLQMALPELLVQTGTSGQQFARLLVRVWQETRQNEFPDIERAAESVGRRRMPLSLEDTLHIVKQLGLSIRWIDSERRHDGDRLLRARFEAPDTIVINRQLRDQPERLKYTLAFFIGHRILHNGDGAVPPHSVTGAAPIEEAGQQASGGMAPRDVLMAWRDFECSAFAGALLCPKQPFRQFLVRERHEIAACERLGITPAVMMRRMTAISPYRHWHFFDGYAPGYLRAVYRGNGIALPHARTEHVKRIVVAVGRSDSGINFDDKGEIVRDSRLAHGGDLTGMEQNGLKGGKSESPAPALDGRGNGRSEDLGWAGQARKSAGVSDQSSSSLTTLREEAFWYSVTRPSKKFCSFLMSIISASHGRGFLTPGESGERPQLSSRRSAM